MFYAEESDQVKGYSRQYLDQLKSLKEDGAEWCSEVESTVKSLESDHEITVRTSVGIARRNNASTITLDSFRKSVVIPYVDRLIENIKSWFSGEDVAVVAMSIFNPAVLPQADDPTLRTYGKEDTNN